MPKLITPLSRRITDEFDAKICGEPRSGTLSAATPEAAMLLGRIALNQALLEKLQARGFLLGMLCAAGFEARCCVCGSALAFALSHINQHLIPPIFRRSPSS